MINKRAIEMSFSLIFSIIAGAIILFLAIYAATRFIGSSQQVEYSQAAKDLLNMLNPVVNDISTIYAPAPLLFKKDTRIYLSCYPSDRNQFFGRQALAFSENSGMLAGWPNPGLNVSRNNKYIFSENMIQGKKLYIFSKPFYAGFRVDDLIILSFDNYCFVTPPDFIKNEIEDRALRNVNFSLRTDLCPRDFKKVCFGFQNSGCNISVIGSCNDANCDSDYGIFDEGEVIKDGKRLPYFGSLMYAAIFSSSEIYGCNLNRLGVKISELASVYNEKIDIVKDKDCNSVISPFLTQIASLSRNLTYSKMSQVRIQARLMDGENSLATCKIYSPEK